MTRKVHFNPWVELCGLLLVLLALLALHGAIAEHGGRAADGPSHAACCDAITNWQAP